VGFDWPDASGPRAKVDEELAELDDTLRREHPPRSHEELGDLLFSIVNLARHLGVDAHDALADATTKFERRFDRLRAAVEARGDDADTLDGPALEALWQALKDAP
jgi:ATP diphosphatase